MEVLTQPIDVHDATPGARFGRADLTAFCRLDELGLEVVGQRVELDGAVLSCRIVDPDRWCHRCGCEGTARDTGVPSHDAPTRHTLTPAAPTPLVGFHDTTTQHRLIRVESLAGDDESELVEPAEGGQVSTAETRGASVDHVEVFQMSV